MLTKAEAEYTVKGEVVQDLGEFQSEPDYVVMLWAACMEGGADFDGDDGYAVEIEPADFVEFPALTGYTKARLWKGDTGFVNCILE